MSGHDFPGGPVEIPRPGIVPEPLPMREHLGLSGLRQRGEIREAPQPPFVEWNHRGDLRLLQHEFRHHDRIRIGGPAPGQIASESLKPRCKPGAKLSRVERRGEVQERHECHKQKHLGKRDRSPGG